MILQGDRTFRNVHQNLYFQIGTRDISDDCLQVIGFENDEAVDRIFALVALLIQAIAFGVIEKALVDNQIFGLLYWTCLDFLSKNQKGRFCRHQETIFRGLQLVLRVEGRHKY